jgi:hypothetical protein
MTLQALDPIQVSSWAQNGWGVRGSYSGKSLVESVSAR